MKTPSKPPAGTRPLRIALGSFGEAGHTFPVMALARELRRRGHAVMVHTWDRWQPAIEAEGIEFAAAPQYGPDPATGQYRSSYDVVRMAVVDSQPDFEAFAPDIVVSDVLSNTSALIAERIGAGSVTLVPHVFPIPEPGMTPYSAGMRNPRTPVGRRFWREFSRITEPGYRQGEREYDDLRRDLGLPSAPGPMPTLSRELTLVATLPQLEYPREWPAWVKVSGPLLWEPPAAEPTPLPPGDEPLVLLAPSTAKDLEHRMLRAAMRGLADEPFRVLGTTNRRPLFKPLVVGRRSRLVPWATYSEVMEQASVVVCNGGHGTVARALATGCAVLVVPDDGDQRENAVRVAYSGAGLRLPKRWVTARSLRLATRRLIDEPSFRARAQEMRAWHETNPGDARAADLIERLAARRAAAGA